MWLTTERPEERPTRIEIVLIATLSMAKSIDCGN
jgi:hypothetical protein